MVREFGAAASLLFKQVGVEDLLKSVWVHEQAGGNNMKSLANTVWAIATSGQSDVQLFMAFAKVAERCVGDFNTQDLANAAWA